MTRFWRWFINYYEEIKNKLINNQIHKKVKDYSKNRSDLSTYFNVGKLLVEAQGGIDRNEYGNELINNYALKLTRELGKGFCYIKNEYKIKLGDRYNYIDFLLYNIEYNCYVVVELKVTELKKDYIDQIELYMNYIDKNIKKVTQDNTIGIIVCRKDNRFVMEYSSDDRIYRTTYILN